MEDVRAILGRVPAAAWPTGSAVCVEPLAGACTVHGSGGMLTVVGRQAHDLPVDGRGGGGSRHARAAPSGWTPTAGRGPHRRRSAARGRDRGPEPVPGAGTGAGNSRRPASITCCGTTAPRRPGFSTWEEPTAGCSGGWLPHPAIEAEVVHAVRRELAQTVEDVLVRRFHLYYEHWTAGRLWPERVAELMGEELGWDPAPRPGGGGALPAFVRADGAPLRVNRSLAVSDHDRRSFRRSSRQSVKVQ